MRRSGDLRGARNDALREPQQKIAPATTIRAVAPLKGIGMSARHAS
jgi:hypothetical protein